MTPGDTLFEPKPGYNAKDAWFRSPDWDDLAKAAFETRIARATAHNKIQYTRIKGLALLGSGKPDVETAGYQMLVGILQNPNAPTHEKVTVLSQLGGRDHDRGRLDDAERNLRDALALMGTSPSGSNGLERIRLAEILLARGGQEQLEEARQLLVEEAEGEPVFVSTRFRLAIAAARVSIGLDDPKGAAGWAALALQLAEARHSGLANHPTLGLVDLDPGLRQWLESVTRTA
jgi:hypothetical protein